MSDDIPTLADALLGRPIVRANGEKRTARVHRMEDDDRHLDKPVRCAAPEPVITPFFTAGAKGDPIYPRGEVTMPRGRKKNALPVDSLEGEVTQKKRRGPKPGFKRKAKTPAAANGAPVRYSIDDEGGISVTPDAGDPIHLDADATKRLEIFLERTKALRK